MKPDNSIPSIIQCSICGDRDAGEYHHSIMMRGNICWLCKLELSVDFYPNPQKHNKNNYFKKAGDVLGIHEWECRQRYMIEAIATRSDRINAAVCWSQLKEINCFVRLLRKKGKLQILVPAYLELLKHLTVDGIGIDLR